MEFMFEQSGNVDEIYEQEDDLGFIGIEIFWDKTAGYNSETKVGGDRGRISMPIYKISLGGCIKIIIPTVLGWSTAIYLTSLGQRLWAIEPLHPFNLS